LNDQGQTVALFAPGTDGMDVKDYVSFGLQLADLTVGRVPDGQGAWGLAQPTPGTMNQPQAVAEATRLRINEWMAAPASGEDWFELYNAADLPVALGGLYLTDDLQNPANTRLADLSFIGPHDYVQFMADQKTGKGANHMSFKLSANGEVIGLFATNGMTRLDAVTYGAQTAGVSQGRLPDGGPAIVFFPDTASSGGRNHLPVVVLATWHLEAILEFDRGVLVIRAAGEAAGTLMLQGSTDLRTWNDLQTRALNAGSAEFEQPIRAEIQRQYYRVRLVN
jgi:hypothetical protein